MSSCSCKDSIRCKQCFTNLLDLQLKNNLEIELSTLEISKNKKLKEIENLDFRIDQIKNILKDTSE